MSRVLAELLGAEQPRFGMSIRQLELAAATPSADVRLISEIRRQVTETLHELHLDPRDTTGQELYRALEDRFDMDEAAVRMALGLHEDSQPQDVVLTMQRFLKQHASTASAFALKTATAKRLLKKVPPKRAMKQLHYRSLDSMLKHEPAANIYLAAFLVEPMTWRKKFFDQYAKLQPRDFEVRPVEFIVPTAARWTSLAEQSIAAHKHNIAAFKELGVVILLPMSHDMPGLILTGLLLALEAENEIMSTSSYLKLQQVKSDFGEKVRGIAEREPLTGATLVDRPVPWSVVHQYYARFAEVFNPAVFEPHIFQGDMQWHVPEAVLTALHPGLAFWQKTHFALHNHDKQTVSLSLLDVAINRCNQLSYDDRSIRIARQNLWQELMTRYLNHENVEQAIGNELQPAYAEIT